MVFKTLLTNRITYFIFVNEFLKKLTRLTFAGGQNKMKLDIEINAGYYYITYVTRFTAKNMDNVTLIYYYKLDGGYHLDYIIVTRDTAAGGYVRREVKQDADGNLVKRFPWEKRLTYIEKGYINTCLDCLNEFGAEIRHTIFCDRGV
jgi:hypothetical protein